MARRSLQKPFQCTVSALLCLIRLEPHARFSLHAVHHGANPLASELIEIGRVVAESEDPQTRRVDVERWEQQAADAPGEGGAVVRGG